MSSAAAPAEGLRRRRVVGAAADDDNNDQCAAAAADAPPPSPPRTTTPQPTQTSFLPLLFPLLLLIISALSAMIVSRGAPQPYMDEIFHVPQTRRLCERGFPAGLQGDSWDPKITTFPGLYVLGAAYSSLQAGVMRLTTQGLGGGAGGTSSFAALRDALCGEAGALRGLNGLLLALCFFPAFAVRMGVLSRGLRRNESQEDDDQDDDDAASARVDALFTALAAAVLLPTHFFFGFLYYTDVGALLFLLLAAVALQSWAGSTVTATNASATAVAAASLAAAASGAAAVAMRQTNAVWYAFLVGAALLRVAYARMRSENNNRRRENQPLTIITAPLRVVAALARHALAAPSPLRFFSFLAQLLLLFTPPVAFVAFVLLLNGGNVALGDHEAHDASATRHWAHPFYAAVFVAFGVGAPFFASSPAALRRLVGRFYFVVERRRRGAGAAGPQRKKMTKRLSPRAVAAALALVATALAAAHWGTLEHPYLLADNRHYTFYAWRRTLGRHWGVRYAFAPFGAAAWLLLASELAAGVVGGGGGGEDDDDRQEEGLLWVLGFAAACALTLIPAGLIEPRYYTAPAVLAMLHAPGRRRRGLGGGGGAGGGRRLRRLARARRVRRFRGGQRGHPLRVRLPPLFVAGREHGQVYVVIGEGVAVACARVLVGGAAAGCARATVVGRFVGGGSQLMRV
jgi:alpha-1,2-glucosyltransferase